MAVRKSANYLHKESDLYKDVHLDTEWLDSLHNDQTETETSENNLVEQNGFDSAERLPSNENDTDSSDEMDEEDMRLGVVHFDIMLDEHQLPQRDVDIQQNDIPNKITFAAGQEQIPSVFQDKNAEYLAFPTFFWPDMSKKHRKRNICSLE